MVILSLVCLICLLPFVGKPLHIDDTLYVLTAKNIVISPLDFYGYRINWDWGVELPASAIIKNPPGMSYLLALAGVLCNWNEICLHLLVAAIAVFLLLGTYRLARELDADPLYASLITLGTPIFMMSATALMGDILMAATWVWAVFFWIRGARTASHIFLAASVLLISVSFFTKYFGICLVPLLAVYLCIKRENLKICLPYLLVPIVIAGLYQLWTTGLYGEGLLLDAVRFSAVSKGGRFSFFEQGFICLVFAGGGMISLLFTLPLIYKKKAVFAGSVIFLTNALLIFIQGEYAGRLLWGQDGFQWLLLLHSALFAAVGIGIVALVLHDVILDRPAETILLFLWIAGTLIFTAYLNWTISGRNLLPCLPAVGILAAKGLKGAAVPLRYSLLRYGLLIPSLVVSLLVAWGDKNHADSARIAANRISSVRSTDSREVWFQGHWGFQYYMQLHGFRPDDLKSNIDKKSSDILVIPSNNSFTRMPDMNRVDLIDKMTLKVNDTVSVMNQSAGAGYYAAARGPLPYIFGEKHDETYYIFRYR